MGMHGRDGLDEITMRQTYVAACSSAGDLETFTLSHDDFGLERQHFDGISCEGTARKRNN